MLELPCEHFSRLINTHPVLLVSSRKGRVNTVSPLTWYMPQSIDPPLIGASLKPSSLSYHHIRESGDFILGIPGPSMLKAIHFCGVHSGRDIDKINHLGLVTTRAKDVSPLLLSECLGHIECKVRQVEYVGNRPTITGEVLRVCVHPRLYDRGWLPHVRLVYHVEGAIYRIGQEMVDLSEIRPGYVPPAWMS